MSVFSWRHGVIVLSLPVSTKEKSRQYYLARPTCMKSPQHGYRQERYVEIDNDTGDRACKVSIILINTMSGY